MADTLRISIDVGPQVQTTPPNTRRHPPEHQTTAPPNSRRLHPRTPDDPPNTRRHPTSIEMRRVPWHLRPRGRALTGLRPPARTCSPSSRLPRGLPDQTDAATRLTRNGRSSLALAMVIGGGIDRSNLSSRRACVRRKNKSRERSEQKQGRKVERMDEPTVEVRTQARSNPGKCCCKAARMMRANPVGREVGREGKEREKRGRREGGEIDKKGGVGKQQEGGRQRGRRGREERDKRLIRKEGLANHHHK